MEAFWGSIDFAKSAIRICEDMGWAVSGGQFVKSADPCPYRRRDEFAGHHHTEDRISGKIGV